MFCIFVILKTCFIITRSMLKPSPSYLYALPRLPKPFKSGAREPRLHQALRCVHLEHLQSHYTHDADEYTENPGSFRRLKLDSLTCVIQIDSR